MKRCLLGLSMGLCLTAFATTVFAWGTEELDTEKLAVKFAKEVQRGGYGIVATEELQKWVAEQKPLLLIDTMPAADSYNKAHIVGAVNFELPVAEMAEMPASQQAELEQLLGPDRDRLLVFYCGFTKCGRSHNGALWAKKLGYRNVFRYPGGIKAWQEAEAPVAKKK